MSSNTTTILVGSCVIATLHALIPSHWLVFALVGKAQRWSLQRTLRMTALAGLGHILSTVVLGVLLVFTGKSLWGQGEPSALLEHGISSGVLILLGLYYLIAAARHHHVCGHSHEEDETDAPTAKRQVSRFASLSTGGALLMGMTLSPCLDLLSVYAAASRKTWLVIGGISLAMTVITLSLMLVLVTLAHHGLRRISLGWLERNEGYLVGTTLLLLGVALLWE